MYSITLTDSVDSLTLPMLEVPLQEKDIEGATDVTTMDLNVYTDFFAKKRIWSHSWAYMSETDFDALKGFYDRQFTLYQYPEVTIEGLNVTDVVVRLNLSSRKVIDNCGEVQDVQIELRETIQMTTETS